MVAVFGTTYRFGPATVYYSPAPLYHAAPLRFGMVTHALGGTVVVAKRFEAEQATRTGDLNRDAEITYGLIPQLERDMKAAES